MLLLTLHPSFNICECSQQLFGGVEKCIKRWYLNHSTIYSIIRSHFGSSHSGGVQTHLRAMWANFGDKTEEGGLNFIYSLMQDIKFCKQQFQQQDLHVLERLAAIEAHLKLQQQRICNLEQALNQAPMPPELLAVKAPPPYLGQFTTPSPAENVKVDDAKPLPVKAPPPCLGHIASFMPAETVHVKVDDAKPRPAHPPLPLKAPPPVTAKVFAGTGPLTAVQVIEHAK